MNITQSRRNKKPLLEDSLYEADELETEETFIDLKNFIDNILQIMQVENIETASLIYINSLQEICLHSLEKITEKLKSS